jgi:CDP-diacylglycerol---serine O-phosphatidyltransferase
MIKALPNLITLSNLFLGCVAVVLALQGDAQVAGLLIGLCALLDFLDGFLARILKAGSPLGQQLDSLADLISFGMAPAAILFYYLAHTPQTLNGEGLFIVLPYTAFLIAVFSGLRLAKFNIDTRQTNDFIGLPTPANAMVFASIPVVLAYGNAEGVIYPIIEQVVSGLWWMLALVVFFSWLLVSPIRMFSLKFKSMGWEPNRIRYIFILSALLLFILFQINSVPLIAIFYIILSVFRHITTADDTAGSNP